MSRFQAPSSDDSDKMFERPSGRFQAAPDNAHIDTDSKDERSIANRLSAAEKNERHAEKHADDKTVTDPLAPARSHGNEPSRGAKIDAELQREEEELMRKKNV
ncbi:hypothetical protein JR316_0000136 [Psilocybe cubensis]|uniref:Uncharacterized protein n=2 Tax=Psilocybe cubensis TaxID=181762 RepID=A0A8H7Y9C2_PSICU|nr:hypothetical protein JR316_0000136 [Psilocybe cubensis]KAH9486072.1 hypothetical protein JR316_0000136 [Psilocybe cubensis]